MKELSLVFLKKIELQIRGNSILIALLDIPSIWGSENDMFQCKYFRSNIAFSDPGEARVMKKNRPKNLKQFRFLHF